MTEEVDIAAIVVGERHRKDMGDIAALARSIAELGLLHPIVVAPDMRLIAGERRLEAVKRLGWREAPVTIVDLDEIVRGEHAENAHRKDFTLSEAVEIKRALEPLERAAARERMGSPENFSDLAKGNALDKIAKATGMHRTTLAKAEAIVAAAEAEPERFGKLLADMDRGGRANGPYRRLQNIRATERIRAEPQPLPSKGPYRGGFIDYPWAYEPDDENAPTRGVLPYPTMSIDECCAFGARSRFLLAPDAAVGLWVTNFILARGLHMPILQAWELAPKTVVSWPKERAGHGHYVRGHSEHFVIATRGKPTITLTDQTTLLKGPFHLVRKAAHSAKPIEAYSWFESLFPASRYFDLFSRYRHNDKWDCWGAEAPAATVLESA